MGTWRRASSAWRRRVPAGAPSLSVRPSAEPSGRSRSRRRPKPIVGSPTPRMTPGSTRGPGNHGPLCGANEGDREAIRDPLGGPAGAHRTARGSPPDPYPRLRIPEQGGRRRGDANGPRNPSGSSAGPARGAAACLGGDLDNLHTVPTACLGNRAGLLSRSREREVKRAPGYALGWVELKVL